MFNLVYFVSFKSKRADVPVFESEFVIFTNNFDGSFTLKREKEKMTRIQLALRIFTNSKCLIGFLTKDTSTSGKGLMIDIRTVNNS